MTTSFWTTPMSVKALYGENYRVLDIFGPEHILELALCVLACVGMAILYKRSDERRRHRILVVLTVLMLLDEVFKHVFTLATDQWLVNYLPLHLCSINIFISAIVTFWPNDRLKEFLFSVSLPGAVIALLSPSWFCVPVFNAMHLHSYSIHCLLVMYPVLLLAGGFKPNFRRNLSSLLLLVGVAVPIYFVNRLLGTNFMFINSSSSNPITVILANILGERFYLFGFAALLVVVWALLYLPFGGFAKKSSSEAK